MTAVLEGIMRAFDTDTVGDVQLARFQPLLRVFKEEAEKDMVEGLPNFQQDATSKVAVMFACASGCKDLDAVHGSASSLHSMICGMLVESVIQTLLCPLLAQDSCKVGLDSPFLKRVQAIVDQDRKRFGKNEKVVTFVESEEHLAKRTALEQCLQDIHEVIREWKEMQIPLESQTADACCGKQQCELPVLESAGAANGGTLFDAELVQQAASA